MLYFIIILLLLLLTTTPVSIAIFLTGAGLLLLTTDIPAIFIGQVLVGGVDKFSLLAVLFFLVAGNLLTRGTIVRGLIGLAKTAVSFIPGGLSMSGVVACGLFGSVSGSNVATLAAIGGIMMPSMEKEGYSQSFSTGLMTASAILGVIIPPSIPMIIYCSVTDASIGKLFVAGIVPGILIIFIMCIYCFFYAKRSGVSKASFPNKKELSGILIGGLAGLTAPVIIFGGIYSGFFTATEAAVVVTVYAYIVELLVFREMSFKEAYKITVDACIMTAVIMFIVVGAVVLGNYLSLEQIPIAVTKAISGCVESQYAFIALVLVFLLFLGMFLELVAAMLIITPVFMPCVAKFGIDPIHFGMILILGLAIGFVTPPVGLNLYVASSMTKMNLGEVIMATLPFVGILLICLILVAFFPQISLWLPTLIFAE